MTIRSLRMLPLTSLSLLSLFALPAQAGTWTVAKDNLATILMGVDFQDASNGTVVGADNASGGSVVFHTIDGGRTFNNQQDNPLQCATYLDVSYGDSTHAISGGLGMFYRFAGASYTADGRTWNASKDRWLASAYQDVDAVDANTMFMIGSWFRATTEGYGVAASTDGGRTFNYYDWGIDTAARYGSFVTPQVGYVSGGQWPYEESLAKVGKGDFQLSRYVRVPGKNMPKELRNAKADYDGYRGVIAKTVNGGETWELVYDDYDRFYFNGIHFIDEEEGWAVAEGPEGAFIVHTADGGTTWDEQRFEAGASLFQIKMLNDQEGWAVGAYIGLSYKALFLHTTDGGANWNVVDTGLGKHYIFNIDFVDGGAGYGVSLNASGAGSVLKYTP